MIALRLVTYTLDGVAVYRFACGAPFAHVSFMAGEVLDRLADATGKAFDYQITELPYSTGAWHTVADDAIEAITADRH